MAIFSSEGHTGPLVEVGFSKDKLGSWGDILGQLREEVTPLRIEKLADVLGDELRTKASAVTRKRDMIATYGDKVKDSVKAAEDALQSFVEGLGQAIPILQELNDGIQTEDSEQLRFKGLARDQIDALAQQLQNPFAPKK